MILDKLPYDKAKHVIGGALVAAAAAVICIKAGFPYAWQAALGAAALAGALLEAKQAVMNRKAAVKRDVSLMDALATASGGVLVALPLFATWLIGRF